ncbi:hypothetical protein [Curtobacterium sp. MCSS17_015]|uniref:hypothetical protein n=1 Tax=Curtobacterium sp. MCSS17_015 TaxID=2175666 RepID=UPI0011B471B7|nr:hypothetical protein [Curtobacterium sp. MCSS17_015]WIB25414.1 hypothetical protein DEJ18_10130 [Curtobacterium sp. MCSS17_015]
MNKTLVGKALDGSSFPVQMTWADDGPQVIAVKQATVEGETPGGVLGFDLMLDPAGVEIYEPAGSVGFQMKVTFNSRGERRGGADGITFYNGQIVPQWIQLQTGIPLDTPFDEVAIELWMSR